jgi:hypothetical protein
MPAMKDRSPISHSHEYYVDLVQRSPKIPQSEWTPDEIELNSHIGFGGGFYTLFKARLEAETAPDPIAFRKDGNSACVMLVTMEEKYTEQWSHFLNTNVNLMKQVNQALNILSVYEELMSHYYDLLMESNSKKDNTEVDKFEALNAEEVGVYAWRQLAPLLREAASKLTNEGIDLKGMFLG